MGSRGGSRSDNPSGHDHPKAVTDALDAFQTALAERYMQVMYDAVRWSSPQNFPGPAHLEGAVPEVWDYTAEAAQAHLSWHCRFLDWYLEHTHGETPQGVTCEGLIPVTVTYSDGSDRGFTCGMGELISLAYEWAWKDREYVFERIPPFAVQNIEALKTTRDAYLNAAKSFGMDYSGGSGWDVDGEFKLEGVAGSIKDMVRNISFEGYDGYDDWMVGWTGAAAEAAAHGFFHATEPVATWFGSVAYQRVWSDQHASW